MVGVQMGRKVIQACGLAAKQMLVVYHLMVIIEAIRPMKGMDPVKIFWFFCDSEQMIKREFIKIVNPKWFLLFNLALGLLLCVSRGQPQVERQCVYDEKPLIGEGELVQVYLELR